MSAETTPEETDVQIVVLPVPPAEQGDVARKLLEAAGEDVRRVTSVSGGFVAPYGVARKAGVLGYLANEPAGAPELTDDAPTGASLANEEPADAGKGAPGTEVQGAADVAEAEAPKARRTRAAQP